LVRITSRFPVLLNEMTSLILSLSPHTHTHTHTQTTGQYRETGHDRTLAHANMIRRTEFYFLRKRLRIDADCTTLSALIPVGMTQTPAVGASYNSQLTAVFPNRWDTCHWWDDTVGWVSRDSREQEPVLSTNNAG
jgi:hypothetical protein